MTATPPPTSNLPPADPRYAELMQTREAYENLQARFETLKGQTVKIAKERDHWKQKAEHAAGAIDNVYKTLEDARHDFAGTTADSVAKLLTPAAPKPTPPPAVAKDDECQSCQ